MKVYYIFKIKGVFYSPDGEKYEGEWRENKKHGKGTFFCSNGEKYEVYYNDDVINSVGVYETVNGETFKGEFEWKDKNSIEN